MNIVLAEDAALIRAGIREILTTSGHEVVAECAAADELTSTVDRLVSQGQQPDLVITDVRMPPTDTDDGLQAAIALRARHVGLPVLVLSAYVAGPYARQLLEGPGTEGALGYLLKEKVGRVGDFLRAIETVAGGGVIVDPEVVKHITRSGADQSPLARLTLREQEVLARMAQGDTNAELAAALHLSPAAVSKHVANIFLKLGMTPDDGNRRVRAVLAWLEHQSDH